MKKYFLFLLLSLMVFSTPAKGQTNYDFKYGIKFGLNFASFSGTITESQRSATGLNLGFLLRKPVSENIFLQAELLLTEKGAIDAATVDSIFYDFTWFLNYFELPVIIGIDLLNNSDSPLFPVLYGGGFIGVKTSAKLAGNEGSNYRELDYPDAASLDYGIVLGGTIEIPITSKRILLDFRYTKSLTGFDNADNYPLDWKNQVITASLGFIF